MVSRCAAGGLYNNIESHGRRRLIPTKVFVVFVRFVRFVRNSFSVFVILRG
jgi:hypothetical protein